MHKQALHREEQLKEQERRHEEQMKVLREIIDKRSSTTENEGTTPTTSTVVATPNFPAFDSSTELWSDYIGRDSASSLLPIPFRKTKSRRLAAWHNGLERRFYDGHN